jgi:predicted dehydrogenase
MTPPSRREFLIQSAGAISAIAIVPNLSAFAAQPASGGDDAVGVAVIGAGRQGRAILGELAKLDGARVVAVCDNDQPRLNSGLRRVQGAKGYTDHRALLDEAKDVRAIIIATPTHLHRQIALDALTAGKHVYCEAPLAHTVDDARAIALASKNAPNLVFASGLEGRSNPIYKLARTFYRSDAVRDAITIEAQHYQKTSWRFPASSPDREAAVNWRLDPEVSIGLPGELGVHQYDVALWYTDRLPSSVSGGGAIRAYDDGRTVHDTTFNTLRFDDGLFMHHQASLGNSYERVHETFRGSNAAIKLAWTAAWMFKEADAPTQGWEVYANRQQFHNEEGITLIADATKLASQGKLKEGVGLPNPPLYYSLYDFLTSIRTNQPAVASAADGMRATVVAIHAHKAASTGTEQRINPSLYEI